MLFLKLMLLLICSGLLACAAGAVVYDLCLAFELGRILRRDNRSSDASLDAPGVILPRPRRGIRWRTAAKLAVIGALAGLVGESILVVPGGQAAIRVSQISGIR